MARPRITGISRPSCPRGHVGDVYLDGSSKSRDRSLERPRFRCLPTEHGERQHVFLEPLSKRRQPGKRMECDACERLFLRAEGLAGGWHFTFVIREIATTLVRVGRGNAYRRISEDLRKAIGRVSARGAHIGEVATTGQLAMDYTDVFAPIVLAPIAVREWPAIVAVDSIPLRISDHSTCCRQEKEEPLPAALLPARFEWLIDDLGDRVLAPTTTSAAPKPYKAPKPKLTHSSTIREVGQVLVAVGQAQLGEKPKVLLARFVAASDELSWTEFFLALPGTPRWIVSDRAIAIINAVRNVWHSQVPHYYCEAHIAKNVESVAREDGCLDGDPIFELIERAQWSEQNWRMLFAAASLVDLPKTTAWMRRNLRLDASQRAKRELPGRSSYPRSAGACEDAIRRIRVAINDRMPHFRNANRLNLFLALAVAEINGQASVAAYSRTLRASLAKTDGRVSPVWGLIRDPRPDYGPNSIETLAQEAEQRAADHKKARTAAKRAAKYQARKAAFEAERQVLGLPTRTRFSLPPIEKATGSVAGMTVRDFPRLARQWHPTKNGSLRPDDITAGQGLAVWWLCENGSDHEWTARVRNRTISGARCPFCTGRRVAPSDALPATHPAVAAQWHPTKNGTQTAAEVSYGSDHYAWWQCDRYRTHVWRARINSRTGIIASGCRHCAELRGKGGRPPSPIRVPVAA
jgi:hypothetical protein